ncbi:MAG: TonB-dependent receptor [Myxococcales bacterium]|nr:TonB-dependent receptor [Myxococcales bacterium]
MAAARSVSATPAAPDDELPEPPAEEAIGDENRDDAAAGEPGEHDEERTIVVTASRTEESLGDTAVVTEVVTREQIEASGAENVAEILEEQPGIQITPGARGGAGGLGIRLLGLDPQHTLILVDGLRATGRLNGVIDLTRFNSEGIRQVEVVKGPASVLYGSDAMGGVVNLITRDVDRPLMAEVHAAYGSLNTLDTSGMVGVRRKIWRSRLSGGFHRSDGYDLDPSTATTNAPSGYSANVGHRTVIEPRGDVRITATTDYQQRDLQGVIEEGGGAVFDRRNFTRILGASLTPEILWDAPARLRMRLHYTRFDDNALLDQRGDDDLDRLERTKDQLLQAVAQYDHRIGGHSLSAGVEGLVELLETPRLGEDAGRRNRERVALYLQDEWRFGREVEARLVPGVRVDVDSLFGAYAMPRLALRLDPDPKWTFRASYGRGFRAPSFREMFLDFPNAAVGYVIRGDPNLEPEVSWGGLGGIEWRPLPFLDLGAAAFHNRVRNLIIIDTSDAMGNWKYSNVGAAKTQGIELSAQLRAKRILQLAGAYTLTDTRDLILDKALPGRSLHQGSLVVSVKPPRIGTQINLRTKLFGRQLYYGEALDDVMTDPFATVDLRISQKIWRYFDAFVGVDNILGAGDARYIPLTPRSFYGGLNARY